MSKTTITTSELMKEISLLANTKKYNGWSEEETMWLRELVKANVNLQLMVKFFKRHGKNRTSSAIANRIGVLKLAGSL